MNGRTKSEGRSALERIAIAQERQAKALETIATLLSESTFTYESLPGRSQRFIRVYSAQD